MKVIGHTEDMTHQTEDCRRTFFTVQLDSIHFVDIMIAEESNIIYSMENEDGTVVYDDEGHTCKDFAWDWNEVRDLAIKAFEAEYGRRPIFLT